MTPDVVFCCNSTLLAWWLGSALTACGRIGREIERHARTPLATALARHAVDPPADIQAAFFSSPKPGARLQPGFRPAHDDFERHGGGSPGGVWGNAVPHGNLNEWPLFDSGAAVSIVGDGPPCRRSGDRHRLSASSSRCCKQAIPLSSGAAPRPSYRRVPGAVIRPRRTSGYSWGARRLC